MTLFKEDYSVGQVQSSLRSPIKIHTFTIYTSEHPYAMYCDFYGCKKYKF